MAQQFIMNEKAYLWNYSIYDRSH